MNKGVIYDLLNRGGYVLDFSTNDFNDFTSHSAGIPLCSHIIYQKGNL